VKDINRTLEAQLLLFVIQDCQPTYKTSDVKSLTPKFCPQPGLDLVLLCNRAFVG